MKKKQNTRPFHVRIFQPVFTFILIFSGVIAACNLPADQADSVEEISEETVFSDKNARMYQMYFDSSADPAQNELQKRRFIGHLHLADIEDIFGDIQSLPMDEDCNYVGGPVLYEGLIWYATISADLVGVNLISFAPDGARSSAFDLDGDRVVDILDLRLADNRRFSFFTEQLGLDVFKNWLQGLDPFCNSELIRQLGLPELGCDERGDGSSGGDGFAPGSGIVDPFDMLCSEYDTSPGSGILNLGTRSQRSDDIRRTSILEPEAYWSANPSVYKVVETFVTENLTTGEIERIDKIITTVDASTNPPHVVTVVTETVYPSGHGVREYQSYNSDGTPSGPPSRENFNVHPDDRGQDNYDHESSSPAAYLPETFPPSSTGGTQGDPGPEGDDTAVAEFCQRRANHQSGAEQAAGQDPSSMSVSCDDLVGAPSSGNCTILEWARPEDFRDVLHPPTSNGCDTFQSPDDNRHCEPSNIQERLRGLTAQLWSLDAPEISICPAIVCDPALATELRSYTAGDIDVACSVKFEVEPAIENVPTLAPPSASCPRGSKYDPAKGRCVRISQDDDGGNAGGACNLSIAVCSAQGQSFNSVTCECEDIQ